MSQQHGGVPIQRNALKTVFGVKETRVKLELDGLVKYEVFGVELSGVIRANRFARFARIG